MISQLLQDLFTSVVWVMEPHLYTMATLLPWTFDCCGQLGSLKVLGRWESRWLMGTYVEMPPSWEPAKLSQVCFCFLQTVFSYNIGSQQTCANNRHQCSVHAECRDYATGFCCRCVANYTGNGRQCVAEGNVLFLCIFSFGEKERNAFWVLVLVYRHGPWSDLWNMQFLIISSLLRSLVGIPPRMSFFFLIYGTLSCSPVLLLHFWDDGHQEGALLLHFWDDNHQEGASLHNCPLTATERPKHWNDAARTRSCSPSFSFTHTFVFGVLSVLCFFDFETASCHIAWADLKLEIVHM